MGRGFHLRYKGLWKEASRYQKAIKTCVWKARKRPLEF